MASRRPKPTTIEAPKRNTGRAVVAAGRRIDFGDKQQTAQFLKRRAEWQTDAWYYYDEIGEIREAHQFLENACSRVRYFPAYRPTQDADPRPLDPDDPELPPELLATAIAAREACARLTGEDGTLGGLAGGLATLLALVGEGYIVGYQTDEGERWAAVSTDELQVDTGKTPAQIRLRSDPDDREGILLPDESIYGRVWRPHRRFSGRADSPMRPLLSICDELLLLTRAVRATATSRIAGNGLLGIPDEMTLVPLAGTDQQGEDAGHAPDDEDRFVGRLVEHMVQPIADPGHASAVVPIVVRGPADYLKAIVRIDLSRTTDPQLSADRKEALQRIANGLDLPAEIVLGMTDANHWTAWQVDEQTWRAHVEPLVQLIVSGFTAAILRPLLAALEQPQVRLDAVILWYDPAPLVADPDNFDRMAVMHERVVVSDAALRRAGGASEDDAPDDAEAALRRPETPAEPQVEGPPGEPGDVNEEPAEALTAAGRRGRPLGERLLDLDRRLIARIQAEADAAVRRALERAGAKVRSRLQADKTLAAAHRQTPNMRLAAALGRDRLHTLGADEDTLVALELADLRRRFVTLGRSTYQAAYQAGATTAGRDLDEVWDEPARDRADLLLLAGFAVLETGLRAVTYDALFAPAGSADQPGVGQVPPGEYDPTGIVPPATIREAIATAGGHGTAATPGPTGAPGAIAPPGTPAPGGIATGDLILDTFRQSLGLIPAGYRWNYGDAAARITPFQPHEALDGYVFASWDDEQLANPEPWPDEPYYRPGDHTYCQCDWNPVFADEDV